MPKVVSPKVVVPKTSPKKKPQRPRVLHEQPTEVIYNTIEVNGIEIPEKNLKITVEKAKELLDWETEIDCYNRLKEEDPNISREMCDFGDNFLLEDIEGNKVQCWNNCHNRPLNLSWAKSIAQDILKGKWRFNGETIIVSDKGVDLSGQHRLIGLVLAYQEWSVGKHKHSWQNIHPEEPYILSLVCMGVTEDQDTINTLDNVRPRTLSDIFYTTNIFSHLYPEQREDCSRMIASGLKYLWDRTEPSRKGLSDLIFKTHAALLEFYDRHPKMLDCVKHIFELNKKRAISQNIGLQPGPTAAMLYLMGSCESDVDAYLDPNNPPPTEKVLDWGKKEEMFTKAKEFWSEFAQGTDKFIPVQDIFNDLKQEEDPLGIGKNVSLKAKSLALAKAWALYKEDAEMTREGVMPEYGTNANGERVPTEWPTFGGIDWGPPHKDQDGELQKEEEELTEEELDRRKSEIDKQNGRESIKRKVVEHSTRIRRK